MEESVLLKLCSKAKIDRDKGYQDLEEYLGRADDASVHLFQSRLVDMLLQGSSEWETRHGALMGSKAIILARMTPQELISSLLEKAFELADDSEFRVRIAAGEVIGSLCRMYGSDIYRDSRENVLQSIFVNLERDPLTDSAMGEQEETDKLIEKLSSSPSGERRYSADAAQIFHDTAGWKSLETWMKCLQSIIEGLGHNFNPFVDQALLDLIFRALTHTNRFVRETGYYVCASLVACGCVRDGSGTALLDEENAILKYGHQFSEHLCKGLADNWSQVRLASSVATRTFLQSLPSDEARHQFFPTLLPRMCLNRYYMAEGVRIYSQDTWKQVTGTQGRLLVEKYISNVVDYYIEATDADNHAVREAACACIAELGAKVSKEVVHSLIPRMLQALLICFNDDSWPVRDAACVACGNFILCFPEESRSSLPDLYPLFFNNLQDNILSVRQGAALALANVVKAYGGECFSEIIAKVKEGLAGVERQPENTEKYSSLDKGPATYGVVKKLRDNDMTLHTDKQMYSCGSLAPKMGRGKREGGCMDHKFRKEPEPWELADGCIQLVSDLCQLQKFAAKVAELLPLVAKAASYDHYTHHANMKETLCHRIPHMATGLGKRYFKAYLEIFFDAIFASLDSENSLTSAAASNCLAELANFLGPSILRGRIEQYNPRYLERLQSDLGSPAVTSGPGRFQASHLPPLNMPGGSFRPVPFSGQSPTAFDEPGPAFSFPGHT